MEKKSGEKSASEKAMIKISAMLDKQAAKDQEAAARKEAKRVQREVVAVMAFFEGQVPDFLTDAVVDAIERACRVKRVKTPTYEEGYLKTARVLASLFSKTEMFSLPTASQLQREAMSGAQVESLFIELITVDGATVDPIDDSGNRIAERLILKHWTDSDGAPGPGYRYFCAFMRRAVNGPITVEQVKELLPVLVAVNNEMEFAEWNGKPAARDKQARITRARQSRSLRTSKRSAVVKSGTRGRI